ncbi:MGMT family protein, partial [Metarhizium majus ARSEF 297]
MARSDEAAAFFHAVYSAVQEIPRGKVTSYAHIATLVGTRTSPRPHSLHLGKSLRESGLTRWIEGVAAQRPRQVGMCMKHLSSDASHRFNNANVPWQRVINSKGVISPRSRPDGAQNQAAALRDEGVQVTRGAMGEFMVDFDEYGWFPRVLPSEAVGDEAWESSTGEEEEGE